MAESERDDEERGPRWTSNLVGHASAEATLRTAFDSGRMPHAWLIGGARGIGKATLAYRFARTVLASGSTNAGPSLFGGEAAAAPGPVPADHPIFRRIARNAHPDLMAIERPADKEEIPVEAARRAVEFFTLTPAEGGWRILIVDAADELTRSAANALLKVIEEPPAHGLLLLLAHRPGLVLPTIRSRCRSLPMRRLADPDVSQVLTTQWPELPPELATGLLAMAEGSPGRALALGEADGFGWYRDLLTWLTRAPHTDVKALHALADRVAKRDSARTFRTLMDLPAWSLARMIRTGAGQAPAGAVATEAELHAQLLGRHDLGHWAKVWEQVSRFLAEGTALNLDRRHVALSVLTTIAKAA